MRVRENQKNNLLLMFTYLFSVTGTEIPIDLNNFHFGTRKIYFRQLKQILAKFESTKVLTLKTGAKYYSDNKFKRHKSVIILNKGKLYELWKDTKNLLTS